MLLQPAVLSLLWCSAIIALVAIAAAVAGVTVALGWNPDDSGRRQLARERRSQLVESALKLVLGWQLVSLFLFVAAADHLHSLFSGAMCAAGTLNASPLGYPTLAVKIVVFVLSGLALVVIRSASTAWTTSLVRFKYLFLVVLAVALVVENVIQLEYFLDLDPEFITSCCATIFGGDAGGVGAELAALPAGVSRAAFFAVLATTVGAGALYLARGRSPALFALQALPLSALGIAAVVSWVAPAVYQLPTHHCPFCLLSWRYNYVGHVLYAALAVALICGCGSGIVHRMRSLDRFGCIRPGVERRLCVASMTGFAAFSLIALWPTVTSGVRLEGF